ncbi:FHA domain-containing protein [Platanthera zijinensis]|uniref:FHA domain-containing protein n=1 Tax=Platanthera zijinensis TaxID=2320716 RepID=A0AAP0BME7_9ASPA
MENPSIIMSIDEGPKKGETLDCSHGSVIRIGRVIRGNTLAIKDPGISQKHLTVAFHRRISRWAVTDLGTSNGTAVNNAVISPNAPFPLADGDIITIGHKTSISVKISAPALAPEPRTRCGGWIVTAAVTSPMEEEKAVEKALSMPEEDDEDLEKIKGPVKDGGKGPARTKRGGGSARLSWKDEALEPVVPLRPWRMTRPSAMIIEDKEEKVQKTTKNRVKQMEISKKSSRSTRISRKDEVLKSVEIEEKIVGSLSSHLEVQKSNVIVELGKKKKKSKVMDNPIGDRKMLAVRREVAFVVEETDNDKDAIMSEESNSRRDLDFPDKKDLVYSWSSFSEIRGIPNTTSKYREVRLCNIIHELIWDESLNNADFLFLCRIG